MFLACLRTDTSSFIKFLLCRNVGCLRIIMVSAIEMYKTWSFCTVSTFIKCQDTHCLKLVSKWNYLKCKVSTYFLPPSVVKMFAVYTCFLHSASFISVKIHAVDQNPSKHLLFFLTYTCTWRFVIVFFS